MCDKNKFQSVAAMFEAIGSPLETLKEFCVKNNIPHTVHDGGIPPYKKEDLNQCCGQWTPRPATTEDTCCSGARDCRQGIDCEKPISVLQCRTGKPSKAQVRLLARGVRNTRFPEYTCLLAVTGANADILVYVNPRTGEGRSVRHGVRWQFCNTPPETIVRDVSYVNYYVNSPKNDPANNPNVIESFDTRKEADDANIFQSRDCCVKFELTSTDGVWAVNASIESQ